MLFAKVVVHLRLRNKREAKESEAAFLQNMDVAAPLAVVKKIWVAFA